MTKGFPKPCVSTCLWFEQDADAAVRFYTGLVPGSAITGRQVIPIDTPSGPAGSCYLVFFHLAGVPYQALCAGPYQKPSEAYSIVLAVETQDEIDHYWNALTADGGAGGPCGWLKDRWGVSWQVVPAGLDAILYGSDTDKAKRAMQALMTMGKLDIAALKNA
ncbi:MAG: VOC family protein [Hyphomicrobiaceae bacterium]|nr:VOC family protein [Hyphomicrobiaceae bacterium]